LVKVCLNFLEARRILKKGTTNPTGGTYFAENYFAENYFAENYFAENYFAENL